MITAEIADTATTTTTVFGRAYLLAMRADQAGVTVEIHSFTGGYDDSGGAMGWAEWPGHVDGPVRRFSPEPGEWMSGVRM